MAAKRCAGGSVGGESAAAKRTKADHIASKCESIVQAFRKSADLAPNALEVLIHLVHFSLSVCHDERHAYQARAAEMVAKELARIETVLLARLTEAKRVIDNAGKKRQVCQKSVIEAHAVLTDKRFKVNELKHELAYDCLAFRSARTALAEAEGTQRAGDEDQVVAERKKEDLEDAIESVLRPLVLYGGAKGEALEKVTALVSRLAAVFPLDESLATAIPSALAKEPAERGPFDDIVVRELEDSARHHLAELVEFIAGCTPAMAHRAEAALAAREAFLATKRKLHLTAQAYTDAQVQQEECDRDLKAARKAVWDLSTEERRNEKKRRDLSLQCDAFREGPFNAFLELYDRSSHNVVAAETQGGRRGTNTPQNVATPFRVEQARDPRGASASWSEEELHESTAASPPTPLERSMSQEW